MVSLTPASGQFGGWSSIYIQIHDAVAIAKPFMEKGKTSEGLTVAVEILTGCYKTGRKCAAEILAAKDSIAVWGSCLLET